MARPLRLQFPGAAYHVMARGNQGQRIYLDDHDRQMWLATLAEAWKPTGWKIHAYALMANHFHLLLETPEPNLVPGMKWLQGTFTQRQLSLVCAGDPAPWLNAKGSAREAGAGLVAVRPANRRWVAEELAMGYETRVSQALSQIANTRDPHVNKLKETLSECGI